MDSPQHPGRIVHLQGGLRALDDRSGKIRVQVHSTKRFIHFEAPAYSTLYLSLKSLGFQVIGTEFLSSRGFAAPDWCFSPQEGQFKLTLETRAWANMRHTAANENKATVVDISRRCTALLELLGIRIWQMSSAYNGAYLASASGGELPEGSLFDNTYTPHIEAAIHAFLADAASLRDLICEFVWIHVLHGEGEVRKFKTFRTKAKNVGHALAAEIIVEGDNGWLNRLSKLRNDVLHFAPIGAHHAFPPCHTRYVQLPDGGHVRYLSYGLVDRMTAAISMTETIATMSETRIIAELEAFANSLQESEDALEYAWRVLGRLIDLSSRARLASGLLGRMPTITEADIIDFHMR